MIPGKQHSRDHYRANDFKRIEVRFFEVRKGLLLFRKLQYILHRSKDLYL